MKLGIHIWFAYTNPFENKGTLLTDVQRVIDKREDGAVEMRRKGLQQMPRYKPRPPLAEISLAY